MKGTILTLFDCHNSSVRHPRVQSNAWGSPGEAIRAKWGTGWAMDLTFTHGGHNLEPKAMCSRSLQQTSCTNLR